MKKKIALLVTAGLFAVSLMGCLSSNTTPSANQTSTETEVDDKEEKASTGTPIRISFAGGETPPIMRTLEAFEKNFEEKTDGRYDVQLYPNAVLGDDLKATEQVKAGQLDAVVTSPSPIGTIVKEVMVLDLPYLFRNAEEADKILTGPFADYLDEKMAEKGLINMAWYEDGFRNLSNSKHTVKTPEDLKGLKIRTMENPIHLAAWRALGANPTPMAFTDVFTAMQQHVIDGQENPFPTINDGKFYEVQDYITTTEHVYSPFVFIYSAELFEKLPEEDQIIFQETAKELETSNREITREDADHCRKIMEEAGVEVTDLTPEEKQVFQDMMKPLWGDFTDIFGEEALEKLEAELAKL